MRASVPERDSTGNYNMTVESEIQVQIMAENMTRLLDYLHGTLGNDVFNVTVMANAGSASPMTWNDREVIADMVSRHPALGDLIKKLDLKIS